MTQRRLPDGCGGGILLPHGERAAQSGRAGEPDGGLCELEMPGPFG